MLFDIFIVIFHTIFEDLFRELLCLNLHLLYLLHEILHLCLLASISCVFVFMALLGDKLEFRLLILCLGQLRRNLLFGFGFCLGILQLCLLFYWLHLRLILVFQVLWLLFLLNWFQISFIDLAIWIFKILIYFDFPRAAQIQFLVSSLPQIILIIWILLILKLQQSHWIIYGASAKMFIWFIWS